jgi:hypothetical protein
MMGSSFPSLLRIWHFPIRPCTLGLSFANPLLLRDIGRDKEPLPLRLDFDVLHSVRDCALETGHNDTEPI